MYDSEYVYVPEAIVARLLSQHGKELQKLNTKYGVSGHIVSFPQFPLDACHTLHWSGTREAREQAMAGLVQWAEHEGISMESMQVTSVRLDMVLPKVLILALQKKDSRWEAPLEISFPEEGEALEFDGIVSLSGEIQAVFDAQCALFADFQRNFSVTDRCSSFGAAQEEIEICIPSTLVSVLRARKQRKKRRVERVANVTLNLRTDLGKHYLKIQGTCRALKNAQSVLKQWSTEEAVGLRIDFYNECDTTLRNWGFLFNRVDKK